MQTSGSIRWNAQYALLGLHMGEEQHAWKEVENSDCIFVDLLIA
jgi:hypothetical protein